MHITMKWREDMPTLRDAPMRQIVHDALRRVNGRGSVRVVVFSIQHDHLHLIVEADDNAALTAGMRGLAVSLARRFNALWNLSGRVLADRYHREDLTSPGQVRNAIRYVLQNARRHGVALRPGEVDEYSSARWFTGWAEGVFRRTSESATGLLVARARSWLLRDGWKRHGLLVVGESPVAC